MSSLILKNWVFLNKKDSEKSFIKFFLRKEKNGVFQILLLFKAFAVDLKAFFKRMCFACLEMNVKIAARVKKAVQRSTNIQKVEIGCSSEKKSHKRAKNKISLCSESELRMS